MRLSYCDLMKLVEDGVIDADPANVNGASIDVRLGREIKVERAKPDGDFGVVDLRHAKECGVDFETVDISAGALIMPGQFFLAHTVETFNLPNTICADFRLRSSIARCGLNALLANWCDPGWHGAQLTLELHNVCQHNALLVTEGLKIGQMIFDRVEAVPEDRSYATIGRYNLQSGATESLGAC
jgi:dCTP deaminase